MKFTSGYLLLFITFLSTSIAAAVDKRGYSNSYDGGRDYNDKELGYYEGYCGDNRHPHDDGRRRPICAGGGTNGEQRKPICAVACDNLNVIIIENFECRGYDGDSIHHRNDSGRRWPICSGGAEINGERRRLRPPICGITGDGHETDGDGRRPICAGEGVTYNGLNIIVIENFECDGYDGDSSHHRNDDGRRRPICAGGPRTRPRPPICGLTVIITENDRYSDYVEGYCPNGNGKSSHNGKDHEHDKEEHKHGDNNEYQDDEKTEDYNDKTNGDYNLNVNGQNGNHKSGKYD